MSMSWSFSANIQKYVDMLCELTVCHCFPSLHFLLQITITFYFSVEIVIPQHDNILT
jgi:hypothetical protein